MDSKEAIYQLWSPPPVDDIDSKLGLSTANAVIVDSMPLQTHDALIDTGQTAMTEHSVTKDWAERRLSEINSKIDLHRKDWESDVKDMNHKFEILVAESSAKFDRHFSEMTLNNKALLAHVDAQSAKTDAIIARMETNLTRWIVATLFTVFSMAGSYFLKGKWPQDAAPPATVNQAIPAKSTPPNTSPETPSR